jgi:hypothetical protein
MPCHSILSCPIPSSSGCSRTAREALAISARIGIVSGSDANARYSSPMEESWTPPRAAAERRRTAIATERELRGRAVFNSLQADSTLGAGALARIPPGGYATISIVSALRAIAGLSAACRELCVACIASQEALIERNVALAIARRRLPAGRGQDLRGFATSYARASEVLRELPTALPASSEQLRQMVQRNTSWAYSEHAVTRVAVLVFSSESPRRTRGRVRTRFVSSGSATTTHPWFEYSCQNGDKSFYVKSNRQLKRGLLVNAVDHVDCSQSALACARAEPSLDLCRTPPPQQRQRR